MSLCKSFLFIFCLIGAFALVQGAAFGALIAQYNMSETSFTSGTTTCATRRGTGCRASRTTATPPCHRPAACIPRACRRFRATPTTSARRTLRLSMHDLAGLRVRLQRPAAIAQHSGPGQHRPVPVGRDEQRRDDRRLVQNRPGADTMSGNNLTATGVNGGWPSWQRFGYNILSFNAGGGSGQRANLAIESNVAGASTGPGQLYTAYDDSVRSWQGNSNTFFWFFYYLLLTSIIIFCGSWNDRNC